MCLARGVLSPVQQASCCVQGPFDLVQSSVEGVQRHRGTTLTLLKLTRPIMDLMVYLSYTCLKSIFLRIFE